MPPQLFAIVAAAINLAEEIFPQAKMGPTKLGAVLRITQTVATVLGQSGLIPDGAVHDNLAWGKYVQSVFDASPLAHGSPSLQVGPQAIPQPGIATGVGSNPMQQQNPIGITQGGGVSDAVRRALLLGNPKGSQKGE